MSCGEEKAKRWRVTLVDRMALTMGISLSLGLMKMPVTLQLDRGTPNSTLLVLGMGLFPSSIGTFLGKLVTRTYRGAGAGACYGCFALLVSGCLLGLIFGHVE